MKLLGLVMANGFSPENRALASLLALRAGAYDVRVVHHDWPGDREGARPFAEASRAPVTMYDFGWRPNPEGRRPVAAKVWSRLRLVYALMRVTPRLAAWRPDVVYSSAQWWDCIVAAWVARRLGAPHVVHLHYPIGPWLGWPVPRLLLTCARLIAASDFIRREALAHGIPDERVEVIRYPFPLPDLLPPETRAAGRSELGVPPDAPLIGMVARLDRTKGQCEAIQAFGRVARADPEARLVFVGGQMQAGSGMSVEELRAVADATDYGDRVIITGNRSDVPGLLAAFDVFVHPSRKDASPYSVIEAAAFGLPVVGWDDGGVAEIVADEVTGLLAPLDDVGGLGDRLLRLTAEPALARAMGAAGRRRVGEMFAPARSGAQFSALLRATAGDCAPRDAGYRPTPAAQP